MLGLPRKGQLGVGADADCAIVDPVARQARVTIANGPPICIDGAGRGLGGTVVTTARGEAAVRARGLPVQVVDLKRSGFYAGDAARMIYVVSGTQGAGKSAGLSAAGVKVRAGRLGKRRRVAADDRGGRRCKPEGRRHVW